MDPVNANAPGADRPRIPRTVWTLGLVSLFTDMGSEIVHSLLPLLLAVTLGASALTIGLIEGAAEALMLVTKVFSGYISDAIGRRKPLVLLGYGLAAASKPLFPIANSVAMATVARLADRVGKGIRGAPRDAMVGDLVAPEIRGAAFGLRQSLDTVGAVLGPLLAIALMWRFADDIRKVLWFAVLPGIVSVLLLLRVPEPPDGPRKPRRLPLTREGLRSLGPAFWRVAMLGGWIGLARFSEAFLVLRASGRGIPSTWIPLVLVVMSLVYALSSYPAGKLSDALPRRRLLAWGMAALLLADVLLAQPGGYAMLFAGIALWGLHMGLTQGILTSLIADTAPAEFRGTAFGAFNLVSGAALLAASALAGWLWQAQGPAATFWCGAGISAVSLPMLRFVARDDR